MASAAGLALRLVVLNFCTAGFVTTDSAQAQAYLLLFHVDFDDLEVVLKAGLKLGWSAAFVACFGDVAETFHSLSNLNKCAELRGAQHLAVNEVADAMRGEEALPDIGLQLLDSQ